MITLPLDRACLVDALLKPFTHLKDGEPIHLTEAARDMLAEIFYTQEDEWGPQAKQLAVDGLLGKPLFGYVICDLQTGGVTAPIIKLFDHLYLLVPWSERNERRMYEDLQGVCGAQQ